MCLQICVFLFHLHSWAWGSSFLNSILLIESASWRVCYSFFLFSSDVYISSLVLLTLVGGFCGLSFWCTNRYWKIFTTTEANWHVYFLSPLFSLTCLYNLSNSPHKLLNIICAQSTFYPFFALTNVIAFLLLKYCTFSFL
jgi:hypothetical protein